MTPLPAFSAFGIELEYMIVDRASLAVRPLADLLLRDERGTAVNERPRGPLSWSNELTLHLLEIKNRRPDPDPGADTFQAEVREIGACLAPLNARLMPTAMHPWMDPLSETRLWPHQDADIYRAYDRIFGCRQHGFANLQSLHLNLPFANDSEFARLHAAVRLLLPILPALAASSPILEGRPTGLMDNRLAAYLDHQRKVPLTLGQVIPDTMGSEEEYRTRILEPMYRAIAPLDPAGVLHHEWLNARGVIPRFERMALEIRLIDVQECPRVDLALAAAVTAAVRWLYESAEADLAAQQAYPTERLAELLRTCIREADQARVTDPDYLHLLAMSPAPCTAAELWRRLIEAWWTREPTQWTAWGETLGMILERGPLARRILRTVGPDCTFPDLQRVYRTLCDCLDAGHCFQGAV